MLYNILKKDGYCVYSFNGIDLKVKSVDNEGDVFVYINYNGFNPLLTMLFGDFESECEIDSINFEVKKENGIDDNTMYAIINNDDLIGFLKEIYCFIMENRVVLDKILNTRYKNIWSF